MIKRHNNFSKIASILSLSLMLLVGCSTVSEPVKETSLLGSKVEEKNNESTEKQSNNSTNNVENQKDNSAENSNEQESTELTPDESFEIASKAVKEYFNFDADKNSFDPTAIADMGHYWIVRVSNSNGDFEVRISLDDKEPFMFAGSASAANKMMEEYKKAKNVDKVDLTEYYDYYYSKEPISKDESKKIAEEFIQSSPLKDMNLSFSESESFYELKFDSPEKEFYVFAYLKDNTPKDFVFIKINTYLREVSEVTL